MPKVRFLPEGIEVEVEEGESLLHAAERCGAQVGSACGGKCACSTCHVYVKQGAEFLSEKQDDEEDRLDMAFDVRPNSRLGCQSELNSPDALVVCEITRESRQAWFDEHPAERKKKEQEKPHPASPGG